MLKYVLVIVVVLVLAGDGANTTLFPDGFLWGTASGAYQIEGAWNESGKGETNWDRYTHGNPTIIADSKNADIACDFYHRYKEDIALMKSMGAKAYRLSIQWSRIMPTGYLSSLNQEGLRFYSDVIDELLANGIEPFVMMVHFEIPAQLEDIGGWTNEFITPLFEDYARVLFENFGDRVKFWLTFNEPYVMCATGYGFGSFPPSLKLQGTADYMCIHNYLKAHAKVWHLYDEEFRKSQGGKVGISHSTIWVEPEDPTNETQLLATEIGRQFFIGLTVHPIHSVDGDYPPLVKETIANLSLAEGLRRSRLPEFSKEWIKYIKGTADFFGVNHYTTLHCGLGKPKYLFDIVDPGLSCYHEDSWPQSEFVMVKSYPPGFTNLLRWLKDNYNDPLIYITEHGWADKDTLLDNQRIQVLHDYLSSLHDAIVNYNVTVKGYMVWTLMDNFEWRDGYTIKYGLYKVDFDSANLTRTPRKSVGYMRATFQSNEIQPLDDWI